MGTFEIAFWWRLTFDVLPMLEAEAKRRQGQRTDLGQSDIRQQIDESGRATNQAAALFHTNRQYVSDAKKLQQDAPELLEAEAKRRQLARLKQGDEIPVPQKIAERGEAREQAAALFQTNRQYVQDAKNLQQDAPELLQDSARRLTFGGKGIQWAATAKETPAKCSQHLRAGWPDRMGGAGR